MNQIADRDVARWPVQISGRKDDISKRYRSQLEPLTEGILPLFLMSAWN